MATRGTGTVPIVSALFRSRWWWHGSAITDIRASSYSVNNFSVVDLDAARNLRRCGALRWRKPVRCVLACRPIEPRTGSYINIPAFQCPAALQRESRIPRIVTRFNGTLAGCKLNAVSPRDRRDDNAPPLWWQFDGGRKIAADLRPSADRSAVRISLVAKLQVASVRAYSPGSCAMGRTDGRTAPFQNAPFPLKRGGA